jgi:hypothetical protein
MKQKASRKKNLIIFGSIIVSLAVIFAVGPVIIARTISKTVKSVPKAEFMMKVKGVIKQSNDVEKKLYLAGDNNLNYLLVGNKTQELLDNLNKSAVIFGNIVVFHKDGKVQKDTVNGTQPVRMQINVVKFDLI